MPTTSNFGWTTPADTDLVKDGALAIRTLGNAIDTSLVDLKGGTTGQNLRKASNTDLDFTFAGDATNTVVDAAGDLLYGTAADTLGRIAIGTAGQVLTVNSGATAPEWAAASTGKVVQIVNATNGTQTIVSSSTFADSNLSATITPTSASNKVLVFVTHSGCGKYNSNTALQVRLLRGATTILNIESAAASDSGSGENMIGSIAANYLDSPATTSATTYKTQINSRNNTGSAYINDATSPGSNSTITLMEVTP